MEMESWIDLKDLEPEDGWDLKLYIDRDHFSQPEDDEGITPLQKEAWLKDEWCYVNVMVKAFRKDVELGSMSYGFIEYGWFTETDENDNFLSTRWIGIDEITDYVGDELAGAAISAAEEKLTELINSKQEVTK